MHVNKILFKGGWGLIYPGNYTYILITYKMCSGMYVLQDVDRWYSIARFDLSVCLSTIYATLHDL